jgi:subtilisin family serine protease
MGNLNVSRRSKGSIFALVTILSLALGQIILPLQAIAFSPSNNNLDIYRNNAPALERTKNTSVQVNPNQDTNTGLVKDTRLNMKNNALGAYGQLKNIKPITKENYVPGEVLVKYKKNKINLETVSGRTAALNFIRAKSLEKKEDLRKNNISVLRIKDAKTVEQKVAELKNDPNVEYAQPNFQYYPSDIPTDDTLRDRLWGLENTGQKITGPYGANGGPYIPTAGTAGSDISAPEAWAISETASASPVIVAVIDSGVAYNHPDLLGNMWDGAACVGEDSTGNPLSSGCNHGYDYEDDDKIPLPTTSSHGTHIAGTIAAAINNGKGIIGVAPQAKIMALKSSLTTADNVKSINFAKQNGAKIINASWACYGAGANNPIKACGGSYDYQDQAMIDAISGFPGLFITAAGNGEGDNGLGTDPQGDDHDNGQTLHSYPCDHTAPNIICVAATDQNDALATFSDYGATSVDVGAPGTNILSTVADSNLLNETFNEVTPPNLPNGWIKGGTNNNWGTYGTSTKVLYGDLFSYHPSLPNSYLPNADSTVRFPVNLSGSTGANIEFYAKCDTEYYTPETSDYMSLELSGDGINFTEIGKWNEATLDSINGDSNPNNTPPVTLLDAQIPSNLLTSNFKAGFKWHTDSNNIPDINYDGCWVGEVSVTKYSDGSDEKYDYYDGTSMAAPHVAGLAALIEGYNPSLTSSQVKNAILTTGDNIPDLNPIIGTHPISTGKRINAQKALQAVNPAKAITAFSFTTPAAIGVIDETTHTIAVTVPFGTDVTALVATFTTTGSSVAVGATPQVSGTTVNDFSSPVTYTVTAADSSTQDYIVTVTVATPSNIATVTSATYTVSAGGTANETITNIPSGTSKTTFLAALTKGQADQTWNDTGISDPVVTGNTLVVTAQDEITVVTYTVTVNAAPVTLSSLEITTPATKLSYTVGETLDITGLVVTGHYSDGSTQVEPITASDVSGFDSSTPVTGQVLTITFGGKTTTYTVNIVAAPSSAKAITSFVIGSSTGTIDEATHTIAVTVPFGTDVTALVATFTTTGSSVAVGATPQVSGATVNDFSSPVTYTVTAADSSTQDYIVTVTIAAPSSAKAITSFVIGSSTGTIDETAHTIAVVVPYGTDITALAPTIVVSDKATVNPASGVAQDFTSPVTYTVTAEDNTTQDYTVTVIVATPSNVATVTSATYTVSAGGTANETITNIPSGTSKATFLAALTKGQADQTWNDTGISDPVVTGNTLVVTAQDGITVVTYTVTVNAPAPVISSESSTNIQTTSFTATWSTDEPSTSRVIYDTTSHPTLGASPSYGYANSTTVDETKVTSHSVTVSGLNSSTTYYYRTVSHGSPESVGSEITVTTGATPTPSGGGGGGGGGWIPTPTPTPTPSSGGGGGQVLGASTAIGNSANLTKYILKEGDMVSATGSNDPDVYIVNIFGYKRLFLNPAIFNFYGHLTGGWKKIKKIVSEARDAFPTSGLFRNCETNDPKVYALESTGEDIGVLHWVNMTGDQAVAQDPEFFKKVFCINNNEFNWYTKSSIFYTLLSQVPLYSRK